MLFFATSMQMGVYFSFDNPAPLKDALLKTPYNLSESQWSALYSIYSMPNMMLPLIGGIFVDKVGVRVALIFFTSVLTLG